MIKTLYTATAILLLTACAYAQVIKGTVVDATTGNAVAGASVYLSGSSKGTASNTQGEFVLYTNETKKPLVVSYIGYQADTVYNYSGKTLTVKLNPRSHMLREVRIGGKNRDKYMALFLTQFIGENNPGCIISNPDDISFIYHKKTKTLEAKSNGPLIIYNKKLGYKIIYSLSAFSCSRMGLFSAMKTSYKGNYVFVEDTLSLSPGEVKTIHKARDEAYYGSRMHFIRSVWAREVEKNNFFYDYANIAHAINNIRANKDQLLADTSTITLVDAIQHFLEFPCMVIKYNGHNESHVSFQNGPKEDVPVTPVSYIESKLIWSGNLGKQRVGDLLPVGFEPGEALVKTDN